MMQKTFINLSKATYELIESAGIADGTVFDYPLAELDDLITGKVGDEEQTLYARFVDDDGDVRLGELTQVNISRFDNHYLLELEQYDGPQATTTTYKDGVGSDLGQAIERAVEELKRLSPYSMVRL
jgi:hypothetical protein